MKDSILEHKLKFLFALQQVDSQIQEVHELKGDLPSIVADLLEQVTRSKEKVKELNDVMKNARIERDQADVEIIDLGEKIEKYKTQQFQVKSNKQYDALSKEIEMAERRTESLEKEMETFEGRMEIAKKDLETINKQLEEVSAELEEKEKELREINKEHEKEELKLQHDREKLLARIDKADLERYERIRQAKGGKAIVPVRREACGGCFNRVPPQTILEIRQNSKLFVCEHCGRMLVSDQIIQMSASLP